MLTFPPSVRICLGTAIRSGMRTANKRFATSHGIGELHGNELTSCCPEVLAGRATPSLGLCRISALDFASKRTDASNPACSIGRSDGEESLFENFEKKCRLKHYTDPKRSSSYRGKAVEGDDLTQLLQKNHVLEFLLKRAKFGFRF